jgi:hypothetical protein
LRSERSECLETGLLGVGFETALARLLNPLDGGLLNPR